MSASFFRRTKYDGHVLSPLFSLALRLIPEGFPRDASGYFPYSNIMYHPFCGVRVRLTAELCSNISHIDILPLIFSLYVLMFYKQTIIR